MDSLISSLIWNNWQQKLMALATAIVIWFFVSHSISETKTIRNVPIRITSLPADKTIVGMLSNGILSKRITLTLNGAKDVIDEIEPGDVEINIDASMIDRPDWIVQFTKKNLVSLNPAIDLANNITTVSYPEFVIKLNKLVTEKIPVEILPPIGTAPPGYEYLDLWPQKLMQTISGPEEEVYKLKNLGLKITFNLNEITKNDLDNLKSQQLAGSNNEVSMPALAKWRQISIPFRGDYTEELNDPEAAGLRLDFLRQEFLPISQSLPVKIFFPTRNLASINPENTSIGTGGPLIDKHGAVLFTRPLHVKNVSRLFLDVVRDYLEIQIVASPKEERERLPWSLGVVTPNDLEETYVAYQLATHPKQNSATLKKRELLYRKRFREYLQRLAFYVSTEHKLDIESALQDGKVEILEY